jgi:hypothetical protein
MSKTIQKVIPDYIYCPKCGEPLKIEEIKNTEDLKKMEEEGYDAGGRGVCSCGVVLIILHQPLPKSPSFSIFIDIYKR